MQNVPFYSSYNALSRELPRRMASIEREEAVVVVEQIARDASFLHQFRPLLKCAPRTGTDPIILATHLGHTASGAALHLFYWPVGAATPIHDHTSWGVYQCVSGALLEERYARLDDGEQPETAHLRKRWRRRWNHWDGASTVGAYADGIHRIANHSRQPSLSLHMYGPRVDLLDGRDYDPSRDFVCDRIEEVPEVSFMNASLANSLIEKTV